MTQLQDKAHKKDAADSCKKLKEMFGRSAQRPGSTRALDLHRALTRILQENSENIPRAEYKMVAEQIIQETAFTMFHNKHNHGRKQRPTLEIRKIYSVHLGEVCMLL
jgi:hypothetical protein